MRKVLINLVALIVMTSLAFVFVSCGAEQHGGGENVYEEREGYHIVIFDTDGGRFDDESDSEFLHLYVKEGEKVQRPTDPVKNATAREQYEFDGWYIDGIEFDFDSEITQNITIKAQWKVERFSSDLPIIK